MVLGNAIAAQRVSAYGAMQVWDAEGTGEIHFDCQDVQQPNLGHIVENSLVVEVPAGGGGQAG